MLETKHDHYSFKVKIVIITTSFKVSKTNENQLPTASNNKNQQLYNIAVIVNSCSGGEVVIRGSLHGLPYLLSM